jgi:hypothetical protein
MLVLNENSLEIHLSGPTELVLESIVFRHKLAGQEVRQLKRGKVAPTVCGVAPLPWTSAVKAFVQLAIQVALQRFVDGDNESDPFAFGLTGDKGSPCRSLDYAISKKPAWVMDLFGANADGCSHVGRFFWRRNPEGKRSGPSSVTLNTKMVSPESISVCVNGKRLEGRDQITTALNGLAGAVGPCKRRAGGEPNSDATTAALRADGCSFKDVLAGLMKRELLRTLSSTPIFSRQGLADSVQQIGTNRLFKSIAGKHVQSLESVLEWSSHTARTGISPSVHTLRAFYSPEKPLQISVSVVTIGTIVLFQYLKVFRDIPIDINYRFSTGIEVARAVQGATIEPDLCAGAAPSAISIMGRNAAYPYKPVMLMPKHTHRLLSSRNGGDNISQGDYRLLTEEPSGALSYYHELQQRRMLNQHKVSLAHCDPDEALSLLAEDSRELRTILWFPAYDLAQLYCGAQILDSGIDQIGDSWILLLAHERLRRNKHLLSALITELHGAWLDLREDALLMDQMVGSILSDPEYSKVLTRCHGFHKINQRTCSEATSVT